MRSEHEMMRLLVEFAARDRRIRLATLEGSRTNPNIAPDSFQDFDISYFVTDMEAFKADDRWLDRFGKRIMMQKPEAMELFPPELGNWFSYIMLLEDGNKLDLTLIPVDEAADYFASSDGLVSVLLDKDGLAPGEVVPTDRRYWIRRPTARSFDDCCNEFWMTATYVVKGLARNELLFAIDHMNGVVRPNLLRMMAWQIGCERGFDFSLGKNYKFIRNYLPPNDWDALLATYAVHSGSSLWSSLFSCYELFRTCSGSVAAKLGYAYPDYDEAITGYTDKVYRSLRR